VRGEAFNCKAAEDAKKSGAEKKFETRNPKFETNPNDQNPQNSKRLVSDFDSGLFGVILRGNR
jgi:hypothetical protein